MIEHGRMSIRPRVWVIQCFQDFSKLLVRPQADEDKQGVLPETFSSLNSENAVYYYRK
jgi:hypothetical protein